MQETGNWFDPWFGRSLGEGNGNLLQYSCLENPMDTGAWRVTVCGVAVESGATKQVSSKSNLFFFYFFTC